MIADPPLGLNSRERNANRKMLSTISTRQGRLARSTILSLSILAVAVLAVFGNIAHAESVVTVIPVNNKPLGVAVNPLTNRIYVAASLNFEGNVAVIDGATNTVIDRIPTGTGTSAFKIAVNPATNRVYVTNTLGSSVVVIDGRSDKVATSIAVCGAGNPNNVAVNWWTNRVYVACSGPAALAIIDGQTSAVVTTVPLSAYIGSARPVAVNIGTNRIYVGDGSGRNVVVLEGKTDSVIANVVAGSDFHLGIDVNPFTNMVYVSNDVAYGTPGWPYGSVSVINGSSNVVVATIPVGPSPYGVGVDPRTNRVYVANSAGTSNSSSISVIDGATNTVTATVPAPAWAIDVAANPWTRLVYVAEYYICKSSSCSADPNQNSVLVISETPPDQGSN